MKIIHLISSLDRGGAENHLRDLVKGQRELGHEISIGFLRNNGELRNVFEEMGCTVSGPFITEGYLSFSSILRIRSFIVDSCADLLHTHMPPASLFGVLASIGLKIPWVASLHNDERFVELPGQRILGRLIYNKAQQLAAISSAVKNFTIKEFYLADNAPISVIPYGIDLTPYENVPANDVVKLKREWATDENCFVIGTIARLTTQKSLDTLINSIAKLKEQQKKIKLVIVGAGPLEEQLKSLTTDLKLENDIIFAGRRSDIPTVLKSFDLFVLPSIYEGLGLVLLESMAAGTPIIASRVSAIPEIVVESETGLLFEKKDINELSSKIAMIIENPDLRVKFNKAGIKRVKEVYSLKNMLDQTEIVYQKALL